MSVWKEDFLCGKSYNCQKDHVSLEMDKNYLYKISGCNSSENHVSNPLPVGAVVLLNAVVLKLCWTGTLRQIEWALAVTGSHSGNVLPFQCARACQPRAFPYLKYTKPQPFLKYTKPPYFLKYTPTPLWTIQGVSEKSVFLWNQHLITV